MTSFKRKFKYLKGMTKWKLQIKPISFTLCEFETQKCTLHREIVLKNNLNIQPTQTMKNT